MPVMGGFEFLERWAAIRPTTSPTNVLMMFTSSDNPSDREQAEQFDFVRGYIVKMPRTADELREGVEQAMV